eukprot:GFUD01003705.1.p1 GENE.GFUD01003705.1~~GFUD01003705.1.p1  ORF type:complete len:163 (-),score=35.51 GFUD01003705.1:270-758(-)
MTVFSIATVLSFLLTITSSEDISNGWGSQYSWVNSLEAAKSQAISEQKPLMLIIHKSWCGACKKLKALFSTDQEILDLSKNFVMVNLGDENEPSDPLYKPDGGYIPRILFFHPDGSFLPSMINKDGNPKYKYYHFSTESVAASMEEVLDLAETWEKKTKDEL